MQMDKQVTDRSGRRFAQFGEPLPSTYLCTFAFAFLASDVGIGWKVKIQAPQADAQAHHLGQLHIGDPSSGRGRVSDYISCFTSDGRLTDRIRVSDLSISQGELRLFSGVSVAENSSLIRSSVTRRPGNARTVTSFA